MWLPTALIILLGVIAVAALVFWSAAEDVENDY
jgi:hypothetical protein